MNAMYTSTWDIVMDWSLCNPYVKNPMLREVLAFRTVWIYYVAMVLDIIIRFNWIFYAIFTRDVQHSAVLSFFVTFSEVCRRGMWTIFRVENEHCTNIYLSRASRDLPLPYKIPSPHLNEAESPHGVPLERQPSRFVAANELEEQQRQRPSAQPPPSTLSHVRSLVATAHAQDFQRKNKTDEMKDGSGRGGSQADHDDDDDEDDDDYDYDDDDQLSANRNS